MSKIYFFRLFLWFCGSRSRVTVTILQIYTHQSHSLLFAIEKSVTLLQQKLNDIVFTMIRMHPRYEIESLLSTSAVYIQMGH